MPDLSSSQWSGTCLTHYSGGGIVETPAPAPVHSSVIVPRHPSSLHSLQPGGGVIKRPRSPCRARSPSPLHGAASVKTVILGHRDGFRQPSGNSLLVEGRPRARSVDLRFPSSTYTTAQAHGSPSSSPPQYQSVAPVQDHRTALFPNRRQTEADIFHTGLVHVAGERKLSEPASPQIIITDVDSHTSSPASHTTNYFNPSGLSTAYRVRHNSDNPHSPTSPHSNPSSPDSDNYSNPNSPASYQQADFSTSLECETEQLAQMLNIAEFQYNNHMVDLLQLPPTLAPVSPGQFTLPSLAPSSSFTLLTPAHQSVHDNSPAQLAETLTATQMQDFQETFNSLQPAMVSMGEDNLRDIDEVVKKDFGF